MVEFSVFFWICAFLQPAKNIEFDWERVQKIRRIVARLQVKSQR